MAVVLAVVLSFKSCNKRHTSVGTQKTVICAPPPQLAGFPRLLEPVGRDFEKSEITHSPLYKRGHSSETGLLGVQTALSELGSCSEWRASENQ